MEHIVRDYKKANPEKIKELAEYGSATVHEAIGRRGAMYSKINPLDNSMKCCGSAVTVKMQAGDNLTLLKALDVAGEGDILVVDNGNMTEEGPWGEIMSIAAMERGIAGLVIDGNVRDSNEIREMGFPVFCTGTCIIGTTKESFGYINQPVSCGKAIVHPGDVILADADGVVIVAVDELDFAIESSRARTQKEEKQIARLRAGEALTEIGNVNAKLRSLGFIE